MLERITYINARKQRRIRVFVYGTLRHGGPNNAGFLSEKYHVAEYIDYATTPGELWVWGGLPFMIPDSSILSPSEEKSVCGEIYGVDTHTLDRLDRLEGIMPYRRPTFDWYSHQIVTCKVQDLKSTEPRYLSALAYVFQMVPRRIRESCMQIPDGDYMKWLHEERERLVTELELEGRSE